MTVRKCIPWPDKRLRTAAAPVEAITDEVRAIWADMIDTMEAMPGVGLAAVQIGVMQRLAVVDASAERGQVCGWPIRRFCTPACNPPRMMRPARPCPVSTPISADRER